MSADARRLVVPVAIIAAVLLFLLINPWIKIEPGSTLSTIVTVAFWILAIAVIVLMYLDSRDPETPAGRGREPAVREVPLREHPGRPVLAADPAVRRLRVAVGGLGQVHRDRLDGRR